ncbi:hypothetical protein RUND412_000910 [Rhizina undulata]
MSESTKDAAPKTFPRVQYAVEDPPEGDVRPGLRRRGSNASTMSIRTYRSNRGSINPQTIPIEYRTLSIQVGEAEQEKKVTAKAGAAEELSQVVWHQLSPAELCERFNTNLRTGLSQEQIPTLLAKYGENKPTPPPNRTLRKLFIYFFGGFGALLLIAGILCLIAWRPLGKPPAPANLALGVVLILVFFIQAGFNAWQDWSSSRVMASISTMLPDNCLTLRDGVQSETAARFLVPGDVIYIRQGNKIPVDLRLTQVSSDLKFDRSVLTGESKPLPGTVESTDDNFLETRCIALQGTHCVSGSAIGICVDTGDRTVFGRIAALSSRPRKGMTTLQLEIFRFIMVVITFVAIVILIVIILWATWLRRDHPKWINGAQLIVDCVSIAVAFVPEGLPIALTTCLTITASVMKKHKVLCKSLATVETLGAVSLVCSDKTGTLTKNQMSVKNVFTGGKQYTPEAARQNITDPTIKQFHTVAGVCNAGTFDATTLHLPLADRKINGDATDQAILRLAEGLGPVQGLNDAWKKVLEIPFNSKSKFMITVVENRDSEDSEYLLLMKGAPDILSERCKQTLTREGTAVELSEDAMLQMKNVQIDWARQGQRVLLLSQRYVSKNEIHSVPGTSAFEDEMLKFASDLTFVGLAGIVDPPRDEIPFVVSTLRRAGIRVFMVTGDFKLTAEAIARDCGILTVSEDHLDDYSCLRRDYQESQDVPVSDSDSATRPDDLESKLVYRERAISLEGRELAKMNTNQWAQLTKYKEVIFARTTPEQKLRIVKEFQNAHEIVAMTGDGVNDAPSLKAADIGIAMGSGSDIAIEAADMVLLDSFAAIVIAVEYGRLVFDNLRKTIAYLLPAGTFSELWPVLINVLFGLPQNLSSFLMIIICCFTDCAGAITLAFEKPESDILLRAPRNIKKDHLVDAKLLGHSYGFIGVLECTCSMAMSFWYIQRKGVPFSALWLKYGTLDPRYDADYVNHVINEGSSIYFVTLVVMQMFNLMATRTRRLSIFQQPPAFNKQTQNLFIFPAMLFALAVVFFFCYVPFFQRILNSTSIPVEHFFLPVAFGFCVLILDDARKACVRRWPKGFLASIAW